MNESTNRPSPGQGFADCVVTPARPIATAVDGAVTLFAQDQYVAFARGDSILVHRFDELAREEEARRPIAELAMPSPIVAVEARDNGRSTPHEIVAALDDGSLWTVHLDLLDESPRARHRRKHRLRPLGHVGGVVSRLVRTRTKLFVVAGHGSGAHPTLSEVDPSGSGAIRTAELPFATLVSLTPLDAARGDLLVAVGPDYEAQAVGFDRNGGSELQVSPFDGISRVTAAAVVEGRWLVLARKGGELIKAPYAPAGDQREQLTRACRRLRALLKTCGCDCDCRHDEPDDHRPQGPGDDPRPDADRPPHGDDEPCGEKHRAELSWSVRSLYPLGRFVVAVSRRRDRLAVLDTDLNVLAERYLGTRGAVPVPGAPTTDRLLLLRPGRDRLEAWSLGEYVGTIRGFEPTLPRRRVDPSQPTKVEFYGRKHRPATPNPDLKICVFTVTEPGQAFNDPDQSRMQALLEPNVYDVVYDYHRENSFNTLDTLFSVFGVDIGSPRRPLVLPQSFASYFYDAFTPGGVRAVMPGDWADPTILDGTESMTLHSDPAAGDGNDYTVPFAALWTGRTHAAYPVVVNFDGTETLDITVVDQEGATHVLAVGFGALNLSHAQGDDEGAFLTAVENHVTTAIRNAEATLPGAPTTLADVVFRRIRANDDDTEFGRLQGQWAVAPPANPADAVQKGTVSISPPATTSAALTALGLDGTGDTSGVLGSATEIGDYFSECLDAALNDAGEGPGLDDPHLSTTVVTTEDAALQEVTVRIELTQAKGGAGASIAVTSHSGLAGTGWTAATTVVGSESTANNQNTMRYHQQLADDVFTAAMDHIRATSVWDADAVRTQFANFDAMMIGFVGSCPTEVPAADRWDSADAIGFGDKRMFVRYHQATDGNNPGPGAPVTMGTDLLIGQKFDRFDAAVMSHEVGHGLGLPDLYSASGYRDDVRYVDRWCQMGGGNSRFNHFCAWSKWAVGWIVEDPADADLNRVIDVPMPDPTAATATEAWLVPVERWDAAMKADVEAAVGDSLPIGQMMKLHLGSDGGVVNVVEFRAPGVSYSQQLPPTPAVIVTNVLQPGTDRRWAVNGLYRRSVHLLNEGDELTNVGDTWDFAAGVEFPLKGCTAEIVDLQTIRGGTIPICRVKVVRESAEFIDLFFQDNIPSWRSPDIWVDWPGDNADPTVARVYPEGTPTDQGEVVRFPSAGIEPHFLVTRVHNAGNVRAEDVKVRWFVCDPPGAGDDGRWVQRDTQTISEVAGGTWQAEPFTWNVTPSTNAHQCLRAEIIDWTIPAEVDPATGDTLSLASDDVLLQNNMAQKNVFDFEALAGSPFDVIEFDFQVHNDAVVTERAYLCPHGLPWGAQLEVSPAMADIAPGQAALFHCKLTLDETIIQPGCSNDQGFRLTAWRVADHADEQWGSCFYHVRPRLKVEMKLVRGTWYKETLSVYGALRVVDATVSVASQLPLHVRVRVEPTGAPASDPVWVTAPVEANGMFHARLDDFPGAAGAVARVQAWFDRTDLLGSCRSDAVSYLYDAPPIVN